MNERKGFAGNGRRSYDSVIFDADGVLVQLTDRELLHRVIRETFGEFEVEPASEEVEAIVSVKRERLASICDRYGIDVVDFWFRRDSNASRVQCEAIESGEKGLYDDVHVLDRIEVPMGVVSNNQQETIDHLVTHHSLDRRFRTWYGREPTVEGIERKKPNPYYINRALADLDAGRALYVGDSEVDIVAADRAGIDSAFVRRPHRAGHELTVEPTFEVEGLRDLLEFLG